MPDWIRRLGDAFAPPAPGPVRPDLAPASGRSDAASTNRPASVDWGQDARAANLSRAAALTRAARAVSLERLRADTRALTDGRFGQREIGTTGLDEAAVWLAQSLMDIGFAPAGDRVDGEATYFAGFEFQERFGSRRRTESQNVVARLPGSDPNSKEAIILMAHYDNLSAAEKADYTKLRGYRYPNYEGANDNAASVAAVLEIARMVARVGGFPHDVWVFLPSAEEEGLKGTEPWVRAQRGGEQNFWAINFELLGKNPIDDLFVYGGATEGEAHTNPLYHRAFDAAQALGIPVGPGLPQDGDEGMWGRSDHLPFANAGHPAIMAYGGMDADYHQASDTFDRLNFDKIARATSWMGGLTLALADDAALASAVRRPAHRPGRSLNPYRGKTQSRPVRSSVLDLWRARTNDSSAAA